MKITPGKYRTRSGAIATILEIRSDGTLPVKGYVTVQRTDRKQAWKENGEWSLVARQDDFDLVERITPDE